MSERTWGKKGDPLVMRYRPANTKADLRPTSTNKAMDLFLLSWRTQRVASAAAEDIADAAAALATAEGLVETGQYIDSFRPHVSPPHLAGGNLRAAATVANVAPHAAAIEFGNSKRPGRFILLRASRPFHTPRRGD